MHPILAQVNEGGVWVATPTEGLGVSGWLVLGAVVATIAGLCWLANWAVRRSLSGEEASLATRDHVRRLTDGILQTYRQ